MIEEKISSNSIDQYSNLFATKLADSFFLKHEKISGQEILSLCEVKQVNLFVVKELMRKWNQEIEKWQSPFFNYDAPEVKKRMEEFRNELSNNILISKSDFFPLLKSAVEQTLHILFAPYDFYSKMLDARENGILKINHLKNEMRYVRINKAPLDKLIEKLNEQHVEEIGGNEAFAMLDHILEEVIFSPEDVEGYVYSFSKLEPLNVADLFGNKESQFNWSDTVVAPKTFPQESKSVTRELKNSEFKIKDVLTINQKFMFTKILFSGDFEAFTETIEILDHFESMDEVMTYLNKKHPQWDKDSDEYEEFITVILRGYN